MNLLKETKRIIKRHGYTPDDIIFIGSYESGYSCDWQEYEKLADIEYDNDYGSQKIANDLTIILPYGLFLYRVEYDGKEWWECDERSNPYADIVGTGGTNYKKIERLHGGMWATLEKLHNPEYLQFYD